MNNGRAGRVYEFDARRRFRVEPERRLLTKDGEAVGIPLKAFDILMFLIENRGRVVPREEIITHVWFAGQKMKADQILPVDRVLTSQINRLRDVLEDRDKTIIVGVPRIGYRFGVEVLEISQNTVPRNNPPSARPASSSTPAHTAKPISPYASVRPLPLYYVERLELLTKLREMILGAKGGTVAVTALDGMGGIGKTELARALCHDPIVRAAFPDGIVWIEVGRESARTLLDRMKKVARALNEDPSSYDADNCVERYRSLLIDKAALIVLDDIWTKADVEAFLTDSPRCRVLFTTRDMRIAASLGAQNFPTDLLDDDHARAILVKCSGRSLDQLPPLAEEIIRECGHLPLGLSEIGSSLRGKPDERWADVSRKLQRAEVPKLYAPTKVSLDVLGEESPEIRHRYLQLAVLLEDMVATLPILQTLWGMDAIAARDTIDELENRSLARREEGGIKLHNLQLDYVRSEFGDRDILKLIHHSLRLSSHVLQRDSRQFASQITGRLLPFENRGTIRVFLKSIYDAAPRPWLRPLRAALLSPGSGLVRMLEDHTAPVLGVALTADGERAVSASADKTLKLWDLGTGRAMLTLEGHTDSVSGIAVIAGGKRAVSASWDNTLKVWDLKSGRELRTLQGHRAYVSGVAVTEDGKWAVSASWDNTLKVWDLETDRELRTLQGHRAPVLGVAVTADGKRAVSASGDNTLKVWDLATGRTLRTLEGHSAPVVAVAITADGKRAVSASLDSTLKVWELKTGRALRTLQGHRAPVLGVAVAADGERAVSASADKTLKLWDLGTGRAMLTLEGHTESVSGVAVIADGKRAVSASLDSTLKIWDLETDNALRTLEAHTDSVLDVAVTADGKRAVSASEDKTLKVWDLETGRTLRTLVGHTAPVPGVGVTADGKRAVSASRDNTLKVWDLETGRLLRTLEGHTAPVLGVGVTADGKRAVSASVDNTLKVWDPETGRALHTLEGHTAPVWRVAVTADGKRAVSASADNTLKVWDLKTGRALRTLEGHTGYVSDVAMTADGERAVSASEDKTLKVWDLETGRALRTLQGHSAFVHGVAITADGKRAVSASWDNTLKVWDLKTGEVIVSFHCDGGAICCAFADWQRIVAGDSIGRVYFLALEC